MRPKRKPAMLPVDFATTASGCVFTLPLRLVSEANAHEHWRARQKRAKAQRSTTAILMRSLAHRSSWWALPDVVTITRVAPRALDSDNAVGSAKHVRDGVADYLGIDDRRPDVEWVVRQGRASTPNTYGVVVELTWRSGEVEP